MRINIYKYFTAVFLFVLCSCQNQGYQKKIIDLKLYDFNINTEEFYKNSLIQENTKFSFSKQYIRKDTITKTDSHGANKIFSIKYDVTSYSREDVVANYNNVPFFTLESMVDAKQNLMLINAVTKSSQAKIAMLIRELTTDFESDPEISDGTSTYTNYKVYTWRNSTKIVKLITDIQIDFTNPNTVFSKKRDKENIANIESESILFICNPTYEKKLKGNLNSGKWSRFI